MVANCYGGKLSFDLFEIVQVVAAFQQRVAIRLAGVGKEVGP